MDKISTCHFPIFHNLTIGFISFFKRQIAHRFKKFPCRTHIQCYIDLAPIMDTQFSTFSRICNSRSHDINERIFLTMKFKCICAKRICQNNIAAGFKILPVNVYNFSSMFQIPYFRKFSGHKPLFLKECTHSTVKK